ncbi:hypothetical protein [Bacillus sp. FJAT-50079]|uniref:hypothetical protein n=1 Tax=Bacillus sp. FJAT-50079 TaxID=2833577 RepID=UPI001BC95509|nr:hypothetical protein [Bacillus sp. FJAT-50079]MBS4207389.1 hypothetical protein [Bacillus sp. FJAT-50079]
MVTNNFIQKAFSEVIFAERVHQVAFKKCNNDPEYHAASEEVGRLLRQLEETLSTETQSELLNDLESAWGYMYSFLLEYSYCQGLEDSPFIHNELKKYGVSMIKENVKSSYFRPPFHVSLIMSS